MKTTIVTVLISSAILATSNALTIPNPPGNIVQNWTFQDWSFNYWTGLGAIIGSPESAPNAIYGWSGDAYQDLTTTPGQQYSLDFWAAADLYIAPRVTITVDLNHQPLTSYTTPPYPYNPTINRSAHVSAYRFCGHNSAGVRWRRLRLWFHCCQCCSGAGTCKHSPAICGVRSDRCHAPETPPQPSGCRQRRARAGVANWERHWGRILSFVI